MLVESCISEHFNTCALGPLTLLAKLALHCWLQMPLAFEINFGFKPLLSVWVSQVQFSLEGVCGLQSSYTFLYQQNQLHFPYLLLTVPLVDSAT